jgi:hypothetical protein
MQVVTSENFAQLVETGRVDDFKAPEAPAKAETPAKEAQTEPTRGEDGKFVPRGSVDTTEGKEVNGKDAAKTAGEDDDLPERARQQIGKKHRAMKEAEEFGRSQYLERLAAEKRADEAERKLGEREAKSRPATEEAKEPKPEDFATVGEYTEALTDFKVEKKFKAREAESERQRIAAAQAEADRAYSTRVAEAVKKHPDFYEKMEEMGKSGDDRVPTDVVEYIRESEYGPLLQYHLATNQSEFERLKKLSPRRFIAELGKLESTLETPKVAPALASVAKTVSQAPAPITPIDTSSTVVNKDPAKMTFPELREYERQRAANKRR